MDPAMCECVWFMILAVCVCRLGEECGCGCVGVGVWGEMFSPVIICIMDCFY